MSKKQYKLSEMWKVWYSYPNFCGGISLNWDIYMKQEYVSSRVEQLTKKSDGTLLAVTRADATEFYEGEGLSD